MPRIGFTAFRPEDVAVVLSPYFPGSGDGCALSLPSSGTGVQVSGKTEPLVTPEAIDGLQTLLIEAEILSEDDRVTYEEVVETRFARSANGMKP